MVNRLFISICLLFAFTYLFAQEKKEMKFYTRDVKIRYIVEDVNNIKDKNLWYTTDDGKEWKLAKEVSWVYEEKIGSYVIFHTPQDGKYGFFFQFSDLASNLSPEPKPGEQPMVTAIVITTKEIEKAKICFQKGAVLMAQERFDESISEYKKAIELWDEYTDAYIDLGVIYYKKEDYLKALEYFIKAKKTAPAYPEGYTNAGLAYLKLGLLEDSLREFKDAVDVGITNNLLSIDVSEQLLCLARLFMEKKITTKAKQSAELILKIKNAPRSVKKEAEKIVKGG